MGKAYIKKSHIIIEIIGYVFIFAAIIYAVITIFTTKGQIPSHWNAAGEIDGYSSSAVLLIMPLIMFFANLVLSLCVHVLPADMWNLPCTPKPGREIKILSDAVWMMAWMELSIAIYTFLYTVLFRNQMEALLTISSIVLVVVVFILVGWAIVKMIKDNK